MLGKVKRNTAGEHRRTSPKIARQQKSSAQLGDILGWGSGAKTGTHQKTLSRKTVKKRIFSIYLDGYIRLSERRRLITLEAKGLDLPAPS